MSALRASTTDTSRISQSLVMLLVSMAGLMLEVGYTRIISFKLFSFFVFLVIGLSLLGIGSGGVIVAVFQPLKRMATERIVALCSIWGAISIALGYLVIARAPVNTVAIWDYGTGRSLFNLAMLGVISLALFGTFIALGIILAVLLGRARERVGRLYFADLVGAGLGAFLAIPLIILLSPPAVVMLSALVFALVGLLSLPRRPVARTLRSPLGAIGGATSVLLAVGVFAAGLLPDVRPEDTKATDSNPIYSEWGPVFRVDVGGTVGDPLRPDTEVNLLSHDGTFGSALYEFDGDLATLTRYETDARAIPFEILGEPPERNLIIGSAGGNEILASLHFGVDQIEAVELNPVTVSLLRDQFADLTGNLPERPEVDLHQGDGRTYLARSNTQYDLVWFVAPDSYAASNAASSGAFVLAESYLYTSQMIEETLQHMTDDGIMVAQFGELSFDGSPNRTGRYVVTARDALARLGVDNPADHIIVAAELVPTGGDLATIVVKRTPFTPAEVERFGASLSDIAAARATIGIDDFSDHVPIYAPGLATDDHLVAQLAGGSDDQVAALVSANGTAIDPVVDDEPFFWHFERFADVIPNIFEPIRSGDLTVLDQELGIGERVLFLMLVIATLYAGVFLLLPFITVRRKWSALPFKGNSAVYFACLGLGFMFYEISMIQRLVLFLGFPTLSLTVTLAAILVFTGVGALLSNRFAHRPRSLMPAMLGSLLALTLFYQFGLDNLTSALLQQALAVRILVSLAVLAPLGVVLGMFLPFGLRLVSRLTAYDEEYVAWSWAVNGFFSVVGAVLTTMLSMTFGFGVVLYVALVTYALAVGSFVVLHRRGARVPVAEEPTPAEPVEAPVAVGAGAPSPA